MTEDNRRQNLTLELEKADASLAAARLCLGAGLWDDAVSRAYYAAFHAVQAVLLSEGFESRSHHGAHDLFFMHFVRPGRLDAGLAKLLAGLQRYREQADYSRAFRFNELGAREEVRHAEEIQTAMKDYLAQHGWLPKPPPRTPG